MLLWVTHPFLLKLPFDFSTWIDQFLYFRILGNKQSHDFSRAIYIELISTFFKDHKVHSPKLKCSCDFVGLWKIYSCLFIPNCTRNHVITYTNMVATVTSWENDLLDGLRVTFTPNGICTTWPSFPLNCRLLFITSAQK